MDAATRALMEAVDQAFPRVEEVGPTEARLAASKAALAVSDPEPVAQVEDRSIAGPAGDLRVRIYWPQRSDPLPALLFLHGGGWVICDLDSHDGLCRRLVNGAGCAVVSVDYRRAPESHFPAAAEDAYAAASWVVSEACSLGVDAARVAVAGDSAGGNLAAVTALMARDRGGPRLAFQLLVYPVTDHRFDTASYRENSEGYFLTEASMRWYWEQYLGPAEDGSSPYASPLRAPDLSGVAPAMVITAEHDPLRDEGEAYGARLAEAGVPVVVRRYESMFHGFFSLWPYLEGARRANEDAFEALRAAFAR